MDRYIRDIGDNPTSMQRCIKYLYPFIVFNLVKLISYKLIGKASLKSTKKI